MTYNGSGVTSGSFTFLAPKKFVKLDAYNGGAGDTTVIFSCAGNPDKQQVIGANQVVTIDTGWTNTCTSVAISSTNGWDTTYDNLVIE